MQRNTRPAPSNNVQATPSSGSSSSSVPEGVSPRLRDWLDEQHPEGKPLTFSRVSGQSRSPEKDRDNDHEVVEVEEEGDDDGSEEENSGDALARAEEENRMLRDILQRAEKAVERAETELQEVRVKLAETQVLVKVSEHAAVESDELQRQLSAALEREALLREEVEVLKGDLAHALAQNSLSARYAILPRSQSGTAGGEDQEPGNNSGSGTEEGEVDWSAPTKKNPATTTEKKGSPESKSLTRPRLGLVLLSGAMASAWAANNIAVQGLLSAAPQGNGAIAAGIAVSALAAIRLLRGGRQRPEAARARKGTQKVESSS